MLLNYSIAHYNHSNESKREVRKAKQEISMTDQVTSCTNSLLHLLFQNSSDSFLEILQMPIVKSISRLRAIFSEK